MGNLSLSLNQISAYLDKLEKFGISLGLDRINLLLNSLGNPQKSFDSIQVGGTNGKTTTARIIWHLLRGHGIRTGLYVSPHLEDYRERMMVTDTLMPENEFINFFKEIDNKARLIDEEIKPDFITQFELLTALAFNFFQKKAVEAAVLEVGMGGRLDATNVVKSKVAIITSISLEHTKYLGDTVEKISREKAAIINKGSQVIIGNLHKNALEVIEEEAAKQKANTFVLGRDFFLEYHSEKTGGAQKLAIKGIENEYRKVMLPLFGKFHAENTALAIIATETYLKDKVDKSIVKKVIKSISSPGRLEVIMEKPIIIVDGAHNPEGIARLYDFIKRAYPSKRVISILGILEDKDVAKMIELVDKSSDSIVLAPNKSYRSMDEEGYRKMIPSYIKYEMASKISTGLERILSKSKEDDLIVITGSLVTAAEAKEFFNDAALNGR